MKETPAATAPMSTGSLTALFPAGAVVAESCEPGDPALLLDAEAACLGAAVLKRRQEFAAGRLCARRALQQFGIERFALCVAADRRPIWPTQIVGSITHTDGFCAAVVAERGAFDAVGIDSEVVSHVDRALWEKICHPDELAKIYGLPVADRARAAALVFSAKEAFYKCQYPLTEQALNFSDVVIEAAWGEMAGRYSVMPTRPLAVATHARPPFAGRFLYHRQFITAALAFQ